MGKAPAYFNIGPVQHREDGSLYCDVTFNQFDMVRDKLLQIEEEVADAAIRSLGYVKRGKCHNVARNKFYGFTCSECGFDQDEPNDYGNHVTFSEWEHCPKCGFTIVEEE